MAPPLLQLTGVRIGFGGEPLLSDASLAVSRRDRIALVGRNGCGKSTLLKIAAGQVEPDGGERFVAPAATVRYLAQEAALDEFRTVSDYLASRNIDGSKTTDAARLLDELGVSPRRETASLSGGEARRVALAAALAGAPDILLLDEPTNHLDLPAIGWLEDYLRPLSAGVVVISHDRRFLETLTTRTVWIDRGETRQLSQGFKAFEEWRDKVLDEEEAVRHKLDRQIVREEHWVRYGVTARRKRNVRRLRELEDMRKARREARRAQGSVVFSSSETAQSGKRVIVADRISKAFGERRIVDGFSAEIARGDKIGLVGRNGAGKTTLLNLLTGALKPDTGSVQLGTNLDIISLDQRRDALASDMRVADAITDGRGDWVEINGEKRHAASYLKDFLFTPEQFRAPVSSLSGGERGRLALASALAKPSNLLVLDEPTNDLDLETLDLLEEFVAGYAGTLLVVSHDRSFLNRTVTSVIAPDPEGRPGKWIEYVGGYDDMVAQRGAAPGLEAARAAPKSSAKAPPLAPAISAKAKLTFKEKFALDNLPSRIAALNEEIAARRKALAAPDLFKRDAVAFTRLAADLEAAEKALAAAEGEWLALELKREEVERP